jgi:hypothetical protein
MSTFPKTLSTKMTTKIQIYNELINLISNNRNHTQIQKTIKELGKEYLSQEWATNIPRYLHLYGVAFREGRPLFNLLKKSIDIPLNNIDIMYMIITGVFWRYYYVTTIINEAISELKSSEIYKMMSNIPYTSELIKLFDDTSVSSNHPHLKKCGEMYGYFNPNWIIEPTSCKKALCKIDTISV